MPIRPEHRWLYPIDWRELSALVRFGRAGGRCEHCRRPHGRRVAHLGDGRWWDETLRGGAGGWRDGRGRRVRVDPPRQAWFDGMAGPPPCASTRVVLATAHLDHDPGNNRLRNLAALCQRCHLAHDRPEHHRRRAATLRARRAIGDLFEGGSDVVGSGQATLRYFADKSFCR